MKKNLEDATKMIFFIKPRSVYLTIYKSLCKNLGKETIYFLVHREIQWPNRKSWKGNILAKTKTETKNKSKTTTTTKNQKSDYRSLFKETVCKNYRLHKWEINPFYYNLVRFESCLLH